MTASNARRLRSAGRASIGVTRDPQRDDAMVAALKFVDEVGRGWVVELTLGDVRNLNLDLVELLSANEIQVRRWWQTLADGTDGRPKAAS